MSSPTSTPYEEQDPDRPLTDEEEEELEEAVGLEPDEEKPLNLNAAFELHGKQMRLIYDSIVGK